MADDMPNDNRLSRAAIKHHWQDDLPGNRFKNSSGEDKTVIPGAQSASPESQDSLMCYCTSEVWSVGPSRNDETAWWIGGSSPRMTTGRNRRIADHDAA
jgi:hypothetical protein